MSGDWGPPASDLGIQTQQVPYYHDTADPAAEIRTANPTPEIRTANLTPEIGIANPTPEIRTTNPAINM